MVRLTSLRKLDHLQLCSSTDVSAGDPGFDDIILVHNAAGNVNLSEIDTKTALFGHELAAPIFIAGMTGGHPKTTVVNSTLAKIAESFNIALGVGSQRAALEDKNLAESFTIVRDVAPHTFIAGNIGAAQILEHGTEWACNAVEMIEADALCIHVNPLQELFQPEGNPVGRNIVSAVKDAVHAVHVPVIVKETGAGMSREAAAAFYAVGASAVDVGGFGGTSWAKVEMIRSGQLPAASDKAHPLSEDTFLSWGIPTAVSVFEVAPIKCGPVIATGGLRSGVDVAKSIVLGADMGGLAKVLLSPALEGEKALSAKLAAVIRELKSAMFLTGSATIPDLQKVRYYMKGVVREMTQDIE